MIAILASLVFAAVDPCAPVQPAAGARSCRRRGVQEGGRRRAVGRVAADSGDGVPGGARARSLGRRIAPGPPRSLPREDEPLPARDGAHGGGRPARRDRRLQGSSSAGSGPLRGARPGGLPLRARRGRRGARGLPRGRDRSRAPRGGRLLPRAPRPPGRRRRRGGPAPRRRRCQPRLRPGRLGPGPPRTPEREVGSSPSPGGTRTHSSLLAAPPSPRRATARSPVRRRASTAHRARAALTCARPGCTAPRSPRRSSGSPGRSARSVGASARTQVHRTSRLADGRRARGSSSRAPSPERHRDQTLDARGMRQRTRACEPPSSQCIGEKAA
jgi:hypothetical protein